MARTQAESIQNLQEAEEVFRQMIELEHQWKQIDENAAKKIREIKKQAAAKGKPLRKEFRDKEKRLARYVETHPQLFPEGKTIVLPDGKFWARVVTEVKTKRDTLDKAKRMRVSGIVRIKESLNRAALSSLSDSKLQKLGASKKRRNKFGYKIGNDEINSQLNRRGL